MDRIFIADYNIGVHHFSLTKIKRSDFGKITEYSAISNGLNFSHLITKKIQKNFRVIQSAVKKVLLSRFLRSNKCVNYTHYIS